MRQRLPILIFLFIGSLTVSSQSGPCNRSINGKVLDVDTQEPIPYAVIKVKGTEKYASSDVQGNFKIDGLCSDSNTLIVSCLGYADSTQDHDHDSSIHFYMTQKVTGLEEVTVKAQIAKATETKTAQETVINAKTLQKYSSLSLGDALKVVSGVSSINTGNTIVKPMINGLHSSRVLITNNGVRLQDQEWGIEHAPNIDVNAANRISVIKGSGALAYGGDAVGGAVIINPRKAILKDTLFGQVILGGQTNGRGYNASAKLNKSYETGWFAQLQGSYRKNGDFSAPDYNLTNTGLEAMGLTTRFGKNTYESGFELFYSYLDTEIGILRGSVVGNAFDLQRAIDLGIPNVIEDFSYDIDVPRQDIKHHLAKATYFKRLKNFGKVNLQYDYQYNQRFEFDVRRGDLRFIPALDLTLQTHSLLADVNLETNPERKYNFGIMGRYQDNFADPDTGVRRLIPDYDKYDFGIYTTTEWRLNDNLTLDAGMRYDFNRIDAKKFYRKFRWEERGYDVDFADIIIEDTGSQYLTNPVFDFHNFSASAGAKFYLNGNSNLIVNYSLTNRPPNPSELFSDGLHHSAARYELGDLRFDKEISNRLSTSYTYNTGRIFFLTEVFYNNIENYIYLKPFDFIETIRGPYAVWEYEQTDGELYGVDVTVNYDITENLEWQNKSAFIKGYEADGTPLIDLPPFTTTNQIKYSNKAWYDFSATVKHEWVFEQNEWPDNNFVVTDRLTDEEVEIRISNPPPAFHLFHLNSEATYPLSEKTSLNVNFGVTNLFNVNYRNYLNQLRFFSFETGRNFTLQLQFNF